MKFVTPILVCAGLALEGLGITPATAPKAAAGTPPVAAVAATLPAQASGSFGTIKGRVVWAGADIPKPKVLDSKAKDPQVCAVKPLYSRDLVIDPKTKGMAHIFAYLPRPKGANPEALKALVEKAPKVEIDQKNCEFLPYSTALHKDQKVVFKSSDAVGHNVHYTGFNNNKNFALGPNGKAEEKLVKDLSVIPLVCDIHPWMKGWILVLDHPFFDVTKEDGTFVIEGVPAGPQNLVVQSGFFGFLTPGQKTGQPIMVKPGEVTEVEIVVDPAKFPKIQAELK
jgi:plastocyanin